MINKTTERINSAKISWEDSRIINMDDDTAAEVLSFTTNRTITVSYVIARRQQLNGTSKKLGDYGNSEAYGDYCKRQRHNQLFILEKVWFPTKKVDGIVTAAWYRYYIHGSKYYK